MTEISGSSTLEDDAPIDGLDLGRLGMWMDQQGLSKGPILAARVLAGGTQNLLVAFRRGDQEYVLRRPFSLGATRGVPTAVREARILQSLDGTDVPHPRILGLCDDSEVLGTPFYLMSRVEGFNPTVELPQRYNQDPEWRYQLGMSIADTAGALAAVDYKKKGLADFGNPDGFLERQVARWRAQLDSYAKKYPGYDASGMPYVEEVSKWLNERCPRSQRAGLMHGDFHLANVMCSDEKPFVTAVIDWELATIGDPLMDLACMMATWPRPGRAVIGPINLPVLDGYPTKEEMLVRYSIQSGMDITPFRWYEVLACFKLGLIVEGTFARSTSAPVGDGIAKMLHESAIELLTRAYDLIEAA